MEPSKDTEPDSVPPHEVESSKQENDTNPRPQIPGFAILFVANLPFTIGELQVINMFSKFGTLLKVELLFHKHGSQYGKPNGCAIVEYARAVDAHQAIEALNSKVIQGRSLVVRVHTPSEAPARPTRLSAQPTQLRKRAQLEAIDSQIANLRAKLQKKSR